MVNDSDVAMRVQPHAGISDRRDFIVRAAGLSLGLLGTALPTTGAAGQDTTPAAVTADPTEPAEGREMASASDHSVLADEDAEAIWFIGCLALIKGVGSQTGGALVTVEFLHPPGFATALHVHHTADESFYVLAGAMRGLCGDQEWRATTGAFVWLPRGIPHGYAVDGDEPLWTLAITVPAGFDRFVIEAGEPARERVLPPPTAPDIAKLEAAGAKYGIETVGPPVQFAGTPTAYRWPVSLVRSEEPEAEQSAGADFNWLSCLGEGSSTVILESGSPCMSAGDW